MTGMITFLSTGKIFKTVSSFRIYARYDRFDKLFLIPGFLLSLESFKRYLILEFILYMENFVLLLNKINHYFFFNF